MFQYLKYINEVFPNLYFVFIFLQTSYIVNDKQQDIQSQVKHRHSGKGITDKNGRILTISDILIIVI